MGTEISVNCHSTKNIIEVGDCNKSDEDCKKLGINQRIGKKKDNTVQEKINGKSNVDNNTIACECKIVNNCNRSKNKCEYTLETIEGNGKMEHPLNLMRNTIESKHTTPLISRSNVDNSNDESNDSQIERNNRSSHNLINHTMTHETAQSSTESMKVDSSAYSNQNNSHSTRHNNSTSNNSPSCTAPNQRSSKIQNKQSPTLPTSRGKGRYRSLSSSSQTIASVTPRSSLNIQSISLKNNGTIHHSKLLSLPRHIRHNNNNNKSPNTKKIRSSTSKHSRSKGRS